MYRATYFSAEQTVEDLFDGDVMILVRLSLSEPARRASQVSPSRSEDAAAVGETEIISSRIEKER